MDKQLFDKFKESIEPGDLVRIISDIPIRKPSCPDLEFQELRIGDVGAVTRIWDDGAVRISLGTYDNSYFSHERRKKWEGYGTLWFEALELISKKPEDATVPLG